MVRNSRIIRSIIYLIWSLTSFMAVAHFTTTASAQSSESVTADFLKSMYQSHAVMTNSGLPGLIDNPGMAYAFFTPEAVQLLPALRQKVHPLTGESSAKVTSWQVTPDSNPAPDAATHLVLVQGESDLKMISFDVLIQDTGPRISNVGRLLPDGSFEWRLVSTGSDASSEQAANSSTEGETAPPSQTVEKAPSGSESIDMAQDVANTDMTDSLSDMTAPNVLDTPFVVTFDGSALPENITVLSEDPNNYLVENGTLTAIAGGRYTDFGRKEASNLFTLEGVEPEGDYQTSIQFRMEPETGYEKISLGFRDAQDDFIVVEGALAKNGCGHSILLIMKNVRQLREGARAHETRFEHDLLSQEWMDGYCGDERRAEADQFVQAMKDGATLSLEKRGFYYVGKLDMTVNGTHYSYTSPAMTRFEPMSNLTFLASNNRDTDGQIVVEIDQFSFDIK